MTFANLRAEVEAEFADLTPSPEDALEEWQHTKRVLNFKSGRYEARLLQMRAYAASRPEQRREYQKAFDERRRRDPVRVARLNEYHQKWRKARIASGICTACASPLFRGGYCAPHWARILELQKIRRAKGKLLAEANAKS